MTPLDEHPDGGLVACPWEGVTVRATIHPRPTMSFADRERRAPTWPNRRAGLDVLRKLHADQRRFRAAVQLDVFGGAK
jgi:hypothetical protein